MSIEKLAIMIIMTTPVATFAIDPCALGSYGFRIYLMNVGVQLLAVALLCKYLWNRWNIEIC